jgi:hypothetical protein
MNLFLRLIPQNYANFNFGRLLTNASTINLVNQGNWDYVILQENSGYLASGNTQGFTNSVNNFVNLISTNSPAANIILYQMVPPTTANTTLYNNLQAQWNTLFTNVANNHNSVYVCNVGGAFTTAYSGGSFLSFGYTPTNPDELRYGAQSQFHFLNSGGFLASVCFYSIIFNNKPCIPPQMYFINGFANVATMVPQYHALTQIGYLNGIYIIHGYPPVPCRFNFSVGKYPC